MISCAGRYYWAISILVKWETHHIQRSSDHVMCIDTYAIKCKQHFPHWINERPTVTPSGTATSQPQPRHLGSFFKIEILQIIMSYHIPTFFPSIATSGSKNSTAVGSPAAKISRSTRRPKAKPLAMSSEPVRVGSLIRPRQPTAVRGFSKYVLRCFMEGNWVFAGHVLGGSWRWITSWLTVWSKKPIGVQPKGVQSWPPIWLNEIFNSDGGIGAAGLLLLWNLATSRLSSANWLIHKVMWYTLDMEKKQPRRNTTKTHKNSFNLLHLYSCHCIPQTSKHRSMKISTEEVFEDNKLQLLWTKTSPCSAISMDFLQRRLLWNDTLSCHVSLAVSTAESLWPTRGDGWTSSWRSASHLSSPRVAPRHPGIPEWLNQTLTVHFLELWNTDMPHTLSFFQWCGNQLFHAETM